MSDGSAHTATLRLQRLHFGSVLFHWFAVVRGGFFPIVLVVLQSRARGGQWVAVGLAVLLVLYALGSIARWFTTRYGLTEEALHFRSGVIGRQARVVPFSRIQSVNVRQSLLQRVLRLGEVHVETATQGVASEIVLRSLRWAEAQALQARLVALRAAAVSPRPVVATAAVRLSVAAPVASTTVAASTPSPVADALVAPPHVPAADASRTEHTTTVEPDAPVAAVVAQVRTEELMLAGGTSNNVGVLLAVLVSGCERVRSSFFDDLEVTEGLVGSFDTLLGALGGTWLAALLVGLVLVPLLVASWMVSVAGSVVRYHGFTLERVGEQLRRRHGLFSRVEASAPIARAQALRFRQSLLRRPFGLGELHLVSAGAASAGPNAATGGHQMLLPILRQAELARYVPEVFPQARVRAVLDAPLNDSAWHRPARMAAVRIGLASTIRVAIIAAVVAIVSVPWALRLAWLLPLLWGLAVVRQRARGLALVDGHVVVREGGLARDTVLIPEQKLQLIEVRQGPLQRVFGLGTLRLTTAGVGGDADMVDLPIARVRALQQELTQRLPRAARRADVDRSASHMLHSPSPWTLESVPHVA